MVTRRTLRRSLLWTATLLFAVGFGLNCEKSNLASYLLGSVRLLEPALWARDFLSNTQPLHGAYAWLGALLLKLSPNGWAIGLSNVAAVCVGMGLAYRLVWRTLPDRDPDRDRDPDPQRDAFAACMIVLSLAASSDTGGIGGSYVFSDVFQPSTLGSLGLLAAALAFVVERPALSGLALAFAGAFHLNYLVLALPVFGFAWLFGERERRLRGLLLGLGPALPVLIWSLPLLLANANPSSGVAEEAKRIFQDVRAPHHYHVRSFLPSFLPWLGFQLLGIAALWPGVASEDGRAGQRARSRLLWLLLGFSALIVPAALLSSLVMVRSIDALFAWRFSPHANLLAQVALSGAIARALSRADFAPNGLARHQRVLGGLGLGFLVLAALAGALRPTSLLLLGFVLLALTKPRWQHWLGRSELPGWPEAALALIFTASVASNLVKLYPNSDLLGGKDQDLSALCDWAKQHTARDALLLSPPDEEGVRFRCERAIIADWKTAPVTPTELMAWVTRIEDLTGRRPLRGEADMQGYQQLDRRRLEQLVARYGPDYWIVKRGAAFVPAAAPAFSHGRFSVYRLPPVPLSRGFWGPDPKTVRD